MSRDVTRVRELSYGYEVWCGHATPDPDVAIVLVQDLDQRLYRCCRCDAHSCTHARAVMHFVIDRESA